MLRARFGREERDEPLRRVGRFGLRGDRGGVGGGEVAARRQRADERQARRVEDLGDLRGADRARARCLREFAHRRGPVGKAPQARL